MATYSADPNWALVHDPGLLVLHAGADELFAIEDVADDVAAELLALWREGVMRPDRLSPAGADVFEQLKAAGIVHYLLEPRLEYALDVRFAGSPDRALERALAGALPAGVTLGADADLVLFVRTDGVLADVVDDDYATLSAPHLLLDLAFHHTICLGPLVFAGQTACLACLAARVAHYWGDAAPPPRPAMTEHPGLAAGLAALAVGEILLRADRSLCNRTVAHDLRAHEVRTASVYRLPTCPLCASVAAQRPGSMTLPWVAAS